MPAQTFEKRETLVSQRQPASVRVLKNYSFLASSYAVSRLITFLSLVYLARFLGAHAFGEVNFAYAIFMYSTLLTHMGLMTFGTREVARFPAQIRAQVTNILSLRVALTFASFLVLVFFAVLLPQTRETKALVVLFGLSLFPTAALLDWAFKGVERMQVVGIIEIVRAVPYLLLILFWVKGPSQLLRIPLFFLFSTIVAAGLSLLVFWRDYGSVPLRLNVGFWKEAMRESLPLGLGFMLLQAYYLTDTVLLGVLRDPASVGWYSAAYRMIAFVLVIGGLFFETTFPIISRYYKESRERLPKLLNSSFRVTTLLVIPMAVGGTLLARPILTMLYGPAYGSATIAFQLLIWAVAIELMGMNWGYALMACDRSRAYMKGVSLGAATSVVLNVFLIPRFGLMGAGMARLVSSSLIAFCFWLQFRSVVQLAWWKHFVKPVLATALMAAAMVFSGHDWVLQLALGALTYVAVIFVIAPSERAQALRFANAMLSPSQGGLARSTQPASKRPPMREELIRPEIAE